MHQIKAFSHHAINKDTGSSLFLGSPSISIGQNMGLWALLTYSNKDCFIAIFFQGTECHSIHSKAFPKNYLKELKIAWFQCDNLKIISIILLFLCLAYRHLAGSSSEQTKQIFFPPKPGFKGQIGFDLSKWHKLHMGKKVPSHHLQIGTITG